MVVTRNDDIIALSITLNDDNIALSVADMGGTLAVVDLQGEILWDANLSGTLPHTPTVGDVDGDGQVIGTVCVFRFRLCSSPFALCLHSSVPSVSYLFLSRRGLKGGTSESPLSDFSCTLYPLSEMLLLSFRTSILTLPYRLPRSLVISLLLLLLRPFPLLLVLIHSSSSLTHLPVSLSHIPLPSP